MIVTQHVHIITCTRYNDTKRQAQLHVLHACPRTVRGVELLMTVCMMATPIEGHATITDACMGSAQSSAESHET